jgi:hypothetical protein
MYLRNVGKYLLRCMVSRPISSLYSYENPESRQPIRIRKPAVTTDWLKFLLCVRKFLSLMPVETAVAW